MTMKGSDIVNGVRYPITGVNYVQRNVGPAGRTKDLAYFAFDLTISPCCCHLLCFQSATCRESVFGPRLALAF